MHGDTLVLKHSVISRARLLTGRGWMELYHQARCDPRTGYKALSGGAVHIAVVLRLAKALGLAVSEIIDLEKSGLEDAADGGEQGDGPIAE